MKKLTKKDFFKKRELHTEMVSIPEWGGEVMVREMTGADRDVFDYAVLQGQREGKIHAVKATAVMLCCVDSEGKPMFNELELPELQRLPSRILQKLSESIMRLSGLTGEELEDREKNSETVPTSDSSSGSASDSE